MTYEVGETWTRLWSEMTDASESVAGPTASISCWDFVKCSWGANYLGRWEGRNDARRQEWIRWFGPLSFLPSFLPLAAIASSQRIFGMCDARIPSRLEKVQVTSASERVFHCCRSHVTRFVRACSGGSEHTVCLHAISHGIVFKSFDWCDSISLINSKYEVRRTCALLFLTMGGFWCRSIPPLLPCQRRWLANNDWTDHTAYSAPLSLNLAWWAKAPLTKKKQKPILKKGKATSAYIPIRESCAQSPWWELHGFRDIRGDVRLHYYILRAVNPRSRWCFTTALPFRWIVVSSALLLFSPALFG